MEAGIRAAHDPLGQGCFAEETAGRISPPANGARGVAESERALELRDHGQGQLCAEAMGRSNPRALSSAIRALRRDEERGRNAAALVFAHVRGAAWLARKAGAAAFRSGRL